jgi:hypothetical protein
LRVDGPTFLHLTLRYSVSMIMLTQIELPIIPLQGVTEYYSLPGDVVDEVSVHVVMSCYVEKSRNGSYFTSLLLFA